MKNGKMYANKEDNSRVLRFNNFNTNLFVLSKCSWSESKCSTVYKNSLNAYHQIICLSENILQNFRDKYVNLLIDTISLYSFSLFFFERYLRMIDIIYCHKNPHRQIISGNIHCLHITSESYSEYYIPNIMTILFYI